MRESSALCNKHEDDNTGWCAWLCECGCRNRWEVTRCHCGELKPPPKVRAWWA